MVKKFDEVFKVQVPLMSSDSEAPALVYNKNRSMMFHMPVTKELMKAMGDEPKKFFRISGNVEKQSGQMGVVVKSMDEVEFKEW